MARTRSRQLTFGVVLLAVGIILLVTRFVPLQSAPTWLLGLGLAFSLVAILQRSSAPLVAGMILLGLGAGFVLGDHELAGLHKGTWTLVGLGGGFIGIYVLGLVLGLRAHWWPLVVGLVLVGIGVGRELHYKLVIPPAVEIAVRTWWPAALVVAGIFVVVRALRS